MLTYVGLDAEGQKQFIGTQKDWARYDNGEDTLEEILGETRALEEIMEDTTTLEEKEEALENDIKFDEMKETLPEDGEPDEDQNYPEDLTN